jgi:hypothetical protein
MPFMGGMPPIPPPMGMAPMGMRPGMGPMGKNLEYLKHFLIYWYIRTC